MNSHSWWRDVARTAKECLQSRPTWSKQQWVLGSRHWNVAVAAAVAVGALKCSGCCDGCYGGDGSDMEHGSC